MRSDMAKVTTERPRRGHSWKSLKTGKRLHKDEFDGDDHGSTRAPVSRQRQYGWDAKEFTDVLGPMRKYLRSMVGNPWDKVYSEICKNLDQRTMAGQHILDHFLWEVAKDVIIRDDGLIVVKPSKTQGGNEYFLGNDQLYVHPKTGLLSLTKYKKSQLDSMHLVGRRIYSLHAKDFQIHTITLPDGTVLHCDPESDSPIWFSTTIHTKMDTEPVYNNVAGGPRIQVGVRSVEVKVSLKRSLNRDELKYYGLQNGVKVFNELPEPLKKMKARGNSRWSY